MDLIEWWLKNKEKGGGNKKRDKRQKRMCVEDKKGWV